MSRTRDKPGTESPVTGWAFAGNRKVPINIRPGRLIWAVCSLSLFVGYDKAEKLASQLSLLPWHVYFRTIHSTYYASRVSLQKPDASKAARLSVSKTSHPCLIFSVGSSCQSWEPRRAIPAPLLQIPCAGLWNVEFHRLSQPAFDDLRQLLHSTESSWERRRLVQVFPCEVGISMT